MICEDENVVDSDFCQADKIHHNDKNNTKINEFRKSFGQCNKTKKIYFRRCEMKRRIRDYSKKVKVDVTGM